MESKCLIWGGILEEKNEFFKFYFAHSYYVKPSREENVSMITEYGIKFASGIQSENVFGVQFHPEKSHRYGMKLLKEFMDLKR